MLKGASTYSGDTILQTTVTNAHVELRLDVANALPTGTVLSLQGANGATSNRNTSLNLNGNNQTLGGLSNTGGGSLRTFRVFSSSAATLTVNDAGNRTFSGLIGNGGTNINVIKEGIGTWTLSGANTYDGGTTLSGGILRASSNTALGTGDVAFSGSGVRLVVDTGRNIANNITIGTNTGATGRGLIEAGTTAGTAIVSGNITINNGAANGGHFAAPTANTILDLQGVINSSVPINHRSGTVMYSGGGTGYTSLGVAQGTGIVGANNGIATTATVAIGTSGAANLDLNGFNQSLAGITKGGSAAIIGNSSTANDSMLTTTGTSTFAGVIQDTIGSGTRKVALTVNGGSLTLTGTSNSYTGETNVNQGTLIVDGNISTSLLTTVASGATIAGSGSVGALTIQSGGTVAPGNSPGILNTDDYTQAGNYNVEINGLAAGDDHDQIDVTGTVDITGGSLNITSFTGAYSANDLIFILLNDLSDSITGTYTGFAQGAVVANYGGFDWQISYVADSVGGTFTEGNDIALMAVPEPGAALLGGIGVLLLLRRRRA